MGEFINFFFFFLLVGREFVNSTTDKLKENAPDVTAVNDACRTSYDSCSAADTKIDNTVRANDLLKPVKDASRTSYVYGSAVITKIHNNVRANDLLTPVKDAYDYGSAVVTKIHNAVRANDLLTPVKDAYDYGSAVITKIHNTVRANDLLTPVKDAYRTSYDYGSVAVTKIDNAVRTNGLGKLNSYLPDDEGRVKIAQYATIFAKKFAENVKDYVIREGIRYIPGGGPLIVILYQTLRDVELESLKPEEIKALLEATIGIPGAYSSHGARKLLDELAMRKHDMKSGSQSAARKAIHSRL